jgi:hypothetical protein
MAGKYRGKDFEPNTITAAQLSQSAANVVLVGGSPKINSISYSDNATAVNANTSALITVSGSGFENGVLVYVSTNVCPAVSRVNSSFLSVTVPSKPAGNYPIFVINPDGGYSVYSLGVTYSGLPVWNIDPLPTIGLDSANIYVQLNAVSDTAVSYSLQSGSFLPSSLTLNTNGIISGTIDSPPVSETSYNFTVIATDTNSQKTPRNLTLTGYPVIIATGGTVDNIGSYRIHTFTSTSSFNVTRGGQVEYFIVAGGGGGGGKFYSGGGGAGGVLTGTVIANSNTNYTVTVGAGGTGGSGAYAIGINGGNSSIFGVNAIGGGGGGSYLFDNKNNNIGVGGGSSGGSGGGGSFYALGLGGSGTPGQGYAGGVGGGYISFSLTGGGAGGGGAGGAAANNRGTSVTGGGGIGIWSTFSGSNVAYAGGGGGGGVFEGGTVESGTGHIYGGGRGEGNTNTSVSLTGATNRGGGGGGTATTDAGNDGGSGIVMIRYRI